MGFFSWHRSDDDEPIWNKWADDPGPTPCKMIDDKGNAWLERRYEGYGVFGGKDYYELVAEMNPEFAAKVPTDDVRDAGIALAITLRRKKGLKAVKLPKLVSPECQVAWHDLPDSRSHEGQGHWLT